MGTLYKQLNRRKVLRFAVASAFAPAVYSANAEVDLAVAINRCARMRALAQRCTKLYAQQVLNVLPDNAKSTIGTAINLIQIGFDDLSRASYSADISQQIALMKSNAATVISLVSAPPRREMLLNVSNEADKMTAQADKTTDLLIKTAKSNSASIINTSGKQRFLSQRIAKNYFLASADISSAPLRLQMQADRAEFKAAISTLQNAPVSTTAIRNEIELLNGQWFMFETALDKPRDRPYVMEDVATASERLLEVANSLTTRYEKVISDLVGKS